MVKNNSQKAPAHKRAAEKRGRQAERLALWLLRLKGYRCIGQRVKTPYGELDLVMQRGNFLIFVEVKRRSTIDEALRAITGHQYQRLYRAAAWFSGRYDERGQMDMRFDMIGVAPRSFPRHIKQI